MAQEGSKMPSEGPKEHQEGPTPQIPLNASTLPMNSSREGAPELRRRDVSHILTLGSCHYWDAPAPLTHSAASLAHSRPPILRLTQTQAHSHSALPTLRLTHTQTRSHTDHSSSLLLTALPSYLKTNNTKSTFLLSKWTSCRPRRRMCGKNETRRPPPERNSEMSLSPAAHICSRSCAPSQVRGTPFARQSVERLGPPGAS